MSRNFFIIFLSTFAVLCVGAFSFSWPNTLIQPTYNARALQGELRQQDRTPCPPNNPHCQPPTDTPQQPSDTPQQPSDTPQRPSDTPQRPSDTPQRPSSTSGSSNNDNNSERKTEAALTQNPASKPSETPTREMFTVDPSNPTISVTDTPIATFYPFTMLTPLPTGEVTSQTPGAPVLAVRPFVIVTVVVLVGVVAVGILLSKFNS